MAMRWRGGRESDNVEDRRGMRGPPMVVGGGLGLVVIVILALVFGIDPQFLLNPQPGGPQGGPAAGPQLDERGGGPEDELKKFVRVVLADTEDVWHEQFRQMGRAYQEPTLVLFSGQVGSACGFADAAVGPFYCPADGKVYLDLSFFQALHDRFRAPGDFAQAYVIAHEVGHHVQNLLGISERVSRMRGRVPQAEYNQLSVRLELQADYLAGVWAHHAEESRQILEAGDIEEALRAASAIGDDRLQRQSQGYVVPDSFTHGTSAQRVRWFRRGLESGRISDGDTFNTDDL
jgi:predicted metalloprotease